MAISVLLGALAAMATVAEGPPPEGGMIEPAPRAVLTREDGRYSIDCVGFAGTAVGKHQNISTAGCIQATKATLGSPRAMVRNSVAYAGVERAGSCHRPPMDAGMPVSVMPPAPTICPFQS